jgi:glucosamine--fructose-6-phosphate aminotransferase (isomerizing)
VAADEALGIVRALEALPDQAAAVLGQTGAGDGAAADGAATSGAGSLAAFYEQLASQYHRARDFLYIGRGIEYPIALEGALKLKEISYIHAEGYPAGEMKHGPLALIDRRFPVVAIAPQGATYQKMASNIEEVKARDGVVIVLATEGDDEMATKADAVIPIPASQEWLQPLLIALPLQLLAYDVAVLRGCDVDQPRNLAKSVTVE